MTSPNSISAPSAEPLCHFVQRFEVATLRRLLHRPSTSKLLWDHAQQCSQCRRRFVELPTETCDDGPIPLYFLETGAEDGDRLFERDGWRQGMILRAKSGQGRVLRLVREMAPDAGDRAQATIRLLRLAHGAKGDTLNGEFPERIDEVWLEDRMFRAASMGGFFEAPGGAPRGIPQ